jgi:hypothetical protein
MGTYYAVVNHKRKQKIDLWQIRPHVSIKIRGICHPDSFTGAIALYASYWIWDMEPIALAGDSCFGGPYDTYEDITEEVIKQYNQSYGTNYAFVKD